MAVAPETLEMRDPIRILIIDDEWLVRWSLAHMLAQHGCVVVEREDARAGTRALEDSTDAFDVVLLDHKLPDGRGLDLLTTVTQLAPRSRVIMMSAHMSREEVDDARRLGASAFVPKPFDLDVVWDLVLRSRE